MVTFNLLLSCVLGTAAAVAVLPRDNGVQPGLCCFALQDAASGRAVQQEKLTGDLFLVSRHPNGWYCLDLADKEQILYDRFRNACTINLDGAFQCLDPTPGLTKYGLVRDGGLVLLAVDGGTDYKACPLGNGGPCEMVYGVSKSGLSGCRTLRLAAEGLLGACGGLGG